LATLARKFPCMKSQIHTKFKIFTGELNGTALGSIGAEIEAFAKSVASKSIGVEYLESARRLVISLGYRDDEPSYGIKLHVENLGTWDGKQTTVLEAAMSQAAARLDNILCHELFVTEKNEFCMVVMTHT
jgi:hypothetical protein